MLSGHGKRRKETIMPIVSEVRKELTEHIIPFWNALRDDKNGGFYGYMDHDLELDKNAEKGVILHSRILWFYSNCYLVLGDPDCLDNASHCYEFMKKYCVDPVNGGVYWLMNADGSVSDSMKHTYCQAFFIYALSSYYDASKDDGALKLALEMFETVEKNCTDDVAYLEAMSADWKLIPNDALSENGLMADKTMNTTLHLIEAYTELYRVSSDERVFNRLKFLVELTLDKIYFEPDSRLLVFFDREMNVIGDIHSYGHDIEATWLLDRACEVMGKKKLTARVRAMNEAIVRKIADIAFENGALNNERDKDKISRIHVWWVQAEGVIGFMNAWQKYGEQRYLDISKALWENIKSEIIDRREGGEWYSQILEDGKPDKAKPTVDPWKCPYHNGRMCIEVMKRS